MESVERATYGRFELLGKPELSASLLIKLKAPITTVSHILGHASVKMTLDTYGHYYEDDTSEWINNLGQFVAYADAK
jgi:integrase